MENSSSSHGISFVTIFSVARTWSRPIWYLLVDFYVDNLVLNLDSILLLAFVSLPSLGVTYIIDRKRPGVVSSMSNQSSPFTVLSLRLAPLYLWCQCGILSLQPHKEEQRRTFHDSSVLFIVLQCCSCFVPQARVVGSCFRQSHEFTL